jgi:phosphogluconate dehydratase
MLMEIMGLHLPGASFVNPGTPLRDALTRRRRSGRCPDHRARQRLHAGRAMIDERSIVNGIVGLLATGGSTNHTMHLIAMARPPASIADLAGHFRPVRRRAAAGARLSQRLADVNHFHAAGGMGFLIRELLGGLLHEDVRTVWGDGLAAIRSKRSSAKDKRSFGARARSERRSQGAGGSTAFPADGRPQGAGGQSRHASSSFGGQAGAPRVVEAPAHGVPQPGGLNAAFKAGELEGDFVAVVRFQGPKANGMPELHKLTPVARRPAGPRLQGGAGDRRAHVGRIGKVPAAIHVTPEALDGGDRSPSIRDGDTWLWRQVVASPSRPVPRRTCCAPPMLLTCRCCPVASPRPK